MKLFMDSSTNYLYLALYDNGKEISTLVKDSRNRHSETIIDNLETFLKQNAVEMNDIDSVFVGKGPGSYTGIRISGTICKVLALVKKIKLYSFSSLDLMLVSKLEIDGTYLVRTIAKKNHSYYKLANIKNQKITFLKSDAFAIDDELVPFDTYQKVEASLELYQNKDLAKKLFEKGLYQEEDVFNYVPNYLRSEING